MSSNNIRAQLAIIVGGQPYPFAQPFTQPNLALGTAPLQWQVELAASASGVLWNGAPPFAAPYDFLVILPTETIHIEFVVNGGGAGEYHFTQKCVADFPFMCPGGTAYKGQSGTQSAFTFGTLANITKINALNTNTVDICYVNVFMGQV